jgi:hypothetical protein
VGGMSVFSDITNNIRTTLNGVTINYSTAKATCELQRMIRVINGRFPFIEVVGPVIEVTGRAHRTAVCELKYLLTFTDDTIEDAYSTTATVDPITKKTENVIRDIWALLMADTTRGGFARLTEIDAGGHYFDDDGDTPLFNVCIQVTVTTVVRDSDPNYTGG